MDDEQRRTLLEAIAGLAHVDAESMDPLKTFLPLPAHRLALRPEVVVVLGGRGAGKSALFQFLTTAVWSTKINEIFGSDVTLGKSQWCTAFSQSSMISLDVSMLDRIAETSTDDQLRAFWMYELLRVSATHMGSMIREAGPAFFTSEIEATWKRFEQTSLEFKVNPSRRSQDWCQG